MDTTIPLEVYQDDRRTTVVASVVFCILFVTAMVGLRIYTRTRVIVLFGIDDILAVVALVSEIDDVYLNVKMLSLIRCSSWQQQVVASPSHSVSNILMQSERRKIS